MEGETRESKKGLFTISGYGRLSLKSNNRK
jgi:hypothetical protein